MGNFLGAAHAIAKKQAGLPENVTPPPGKLNWNNKPTLLGSPQ
jgi:hypothetical protein